MTSPIPDPALAQQLVQHAEATRYMAMAGFTILIWDHICTFDEEVKFMWPAPRSLVKILFLGNRYITPIFQVIIVVQISRLVPTSDAFCKVWIVLGGFAEISSLATADLLLLFRIHALWGGRRAVVIGTLALWVLSYLCIGVVGLLAAIEIIPPLRYDHITLQCFSEHKPKVLPAQWVVSLILELVVFFMTAIKAVQHRESDQLRTPILKALYYDQFMYYVAIVFIRIWNLVIWLVFPPSLFFLGLYFIWAVIIALVSRIMLHLRSVACANSPSGNASFFGDTVRSTRIVWARRNTTTALDSSLHTISSSDAHIPVTIARSDTMWDRDEEGLGEAIELQDIRRGKERTWD